MSSAHSLGPAVGAPNSYVPTYLDFPLHALIVAVLLFAFRKQLRHLLKTTCLCSLGFAIWGVGLYLFYHFMVALNWLLPLGRWWLFVFAIGLVTLVFLPALLEIVVLLYKIVRFAKRTTVGIFRYLFLVPVVGASKESTSNSLESIGTHQEEAATQDGTPDPDSPYSILGVRPGVSPDELKSAYIGKIKTNHPDRVASLDPELQRFANERTKQIQSAYETLKGMCCA